MRTGELANILGVADQTVINWMERPEIRKFMSPGAIGEAGNPQRIYTDSDGIVLNTVRHLRSVENATDWAAIEQYLESGRRITEFPQNALATDNRVISIPQAEQSMMAARYQAERDSLVIQLEGLKSHYESQLEHEREQRQIVQEKYEKALRELGRLEAQIEALKGKPDGK